MWSDRPRHARNPVTAIFGHCDTPWEFAEIAGLQLVAYKHDSERCYNMSYLCHEYPDDVAMEPNSIMFHTSASYSQLDCGHFSMKIYLRTPDLDNLATIENLIHKYERDLAQKEVAKAQAEAARARQAIRDSERIVRELIEEEAAQKNAKLKPRPAPPQGERRKRRCAGAIAPRQPFVSADAFPDETALAPLGGAGAE
jgi:hypothetical protein